jgi:hypothetical protein
VYQNENKVYTVMVINSTNIKKTNNHLSHERSEKTLEIQVLTRDRHNNVAELNWLMGSQSFPLDNSIGNTYKNNEKPAQIRFHAKRPYNTITKMNDNINMESTIAGTMNARS